MRWGHLSPGGASAPTDPNQQILPPEEDEEQEEAGLMDPYGGEPRVRQPLVCPCFCDVLIALTLLSFTQ